MLLLLLPEILVLLNSTMMSAAFVLVRKITLNDEKCLFAIAIHFHIFFMTVIEHLK